MALTFRECVYGAVTNALRGLPKGVPPNLDAEYIAETLFPEVSLSVCQKAADNEDRRWAIRRTKSVTLVAGAAALTDDVLTSHMADSVLQDPANVSTRYSWRDYPDFIRGRMPQLGVYTLQGDVSSEDTLLVLDPNQVYSNPLTATGPRNLTIPCKVLRPTNPDDPLDCPNDIAIDIQEALSEALRGTLAKAAGENV